MLGAGIPPVGFPGTGSGGGGVAGIVGVVILACAVLVNYLVARRRAETPTSEVESQSGWMDHYDRALVP